MRPAWQRARRSAKAHPQDLEPRLSEHFKPHYVSRLVASEQLSQLLLLLKVPVDAERAAPSYRGRDQVAYPQAPRIRGAPLRHALDLKAGVLAGGNRVDTYAEVKGSRGALLASWSRYGWILTALAA